MPSPKKGSPGSNGATKPKNKFAAVRMILGSNMAATGTEISKKVKSDYGMSITPKQAGKYRYMILKETRDGGRATGRKAAVASARSSGGDQSGYDDLLRAAQKLGWKRVKVVVDQVIQAPA